MKRSKRSLMGLCFSFILALGFLVPVSWGMPANSKADINTATIEQLEVVKGIGQDTAREILSYRKEHGAFQSMDELLKVKGVGKVRVEALREAFTITKNSEQADGGTQQ